MCVKERTTTYMQCVSVLGAYARTRGRFDTHNYNNFYSMTLNDIIGKRIAIKEFYFRHLMNMGTSIAEASKEPLKLRDVQAWEHFDMLPTKEIKQVRPGEALCFYCLCNLIKWRIVPETPHPRMLLIWPSR